MNANVAVPSDQNNKNMSYPVSFYMNTRIALLPQFIRAYKPSPASQTKRTFAFCRPNVRFRYVSLECFY